MAPKYKKKSKHTKESVNTLLSTKSYKNLNAWRMDDPKSYGWAKTDLDFWAILLKRYFNI